MQSGETELIVVVVSGSLLFLLLFGFLVTLFVVFQQRVARHKQEKITLQENYAKEILQAQVEIQNATLQQISQELHDNIGQLLSVARINLNTLENLEIVGEGQVYVQQTNEIVSQLIRDVRQLTRSFDSDFVLDFGLIDNISNEVDRIAKTKRFEVELKITRNTTRLGYEKEIVVFRIFQELINNCIKHAHASKIDVSLDYDSNFFSLRVCDDGVGLDRLKEKVPVNDSGAGLRNIQRRATLIGASVKFTSNKGFGTCVEVICPLVELV